MALPPLEEDLFTPPLQRSPTIDLLYALLEGHTLNNETDSAGNPVTVVPMSSMVNNLLSWITMSGNIDQAQLPNDPVESRYMARIRSFGHDAVNGALHNHGQSGLSESDIAAHDQILENARKWITHWGVRQGRFENQLHFVNEGTISEQMHLFKSS